MHKTHGNKKVFSSTHQGFTSLFSSVSYDSKISDPQFFSFETSCSSITEVKPFHKFTISISTIAEQILAENSTCLGYIISVGQKLLTSAFYQLLFVDKIYQLLV